MKTAKSWAIMPDYGSDETESDSDIHIYDVEEYRDGEEMDSDEAIARRLQEQFNREAGLHADGSSMRNVDVPTTVYVPIDADHLVLTTPLGVLKSETIHSHFPCPKSSRRNCRIVLQKVSPVVPVINKSSSKYQDSKSEPSLLRSQAIVLSLYQRFKHVPRTRIGLSLSSKGDFSFNFRLGGGR